MISLTAYAAEFTSYAEAIRTAAALGHGINKHADPTEQARVGLTVDEAIAIAAEDPSLIYIVYLG